MFIAYETFKERADRITSELASLCRAAGREPAEVILMPVTKTHPPAAAEYVARYGLKSVGENRVQEGVEKRAAVAAPLQWDLIGHLQSNKAKLAVGAFDRIQSVDSEKLLGHVDRAAAAANKRMRVLLQINAGNDPAKFGAEPELAPRLLEAALRCAHLDVEGLMTIAPLGTSPEETAELARRTFSNLRLIRDRLARESGKPLRELSMGMSADFAIAIAEGSTLVRVGTALFGARE
jgi:PLP dependent protein